MYEVVYKIAIVGDFLFIIWKVTMWLGGLQSQQRIPIQILPTDHTELRNLARLTHGNWSNLIKWPMTSKESETVKSTNSLPKSSRKLRKENAHSTVLVSRATKSKGSARYLVKSSG